MKHRHIYTTLALCIGCCSTIGHAQAMTLSHRVEARRLARIEQHAVTNRLDVLQRRELRKARRTASPSFVSNRKRELLTALNTERARMGIGALRYQKQLEHAAQLHAQDMLDRKYFAHETPEGVTSTVRMQNAGYASTNAQECRCRVTSAFGENIAKGQSTVAQVVDDWMHSPSHREAILNREYDEAGIGIAGDIWVLDFGGVKLEQIVR